MEKVKLPREVAEAIESLRNSDSELDFPPGGPDDAFILLESCQNERVCAEMNFKHWATLHKFVREGRNIFKLADALRYGYEIEPEPITVTITPEMQDELRKVYNDCPFNEKVGFRSALTVLDLKIPGVIV